VKLLSFVFNNILPAIFASQAFTVLSAVAWNFCRLAFLRKQWSTSRKRV